MSQKIRALVVLGHVPETQRIVGSNGSITYDGMFYKLWAMIKENLKGKYEFEETYLTQEETITYNNQVKMVGEGKYDICIDGFNISPDRLKEVDFSEGLFLEKNAILHYPIGTYWKSLSELLIESFVKPFSILIVFAIGVGFLLHYLEPTRWKGSLIPKKFHLRQTILMTISIIFGEGGLMAGKGLYSIRSLIIMIGILFIATIFIAYIQAVITARVIKLEKGAQLNPSNIGNKPVLSQYGNIIAQNIKKLNVELHTIKGSFSDLIKVYEKNPQDYSGIVMSSVAAHYFKQKHPHFRVSDDDFGYFTIHFPVNKKHVDFKRELDIAIQDLHNGDRIINMCKMYPEYIDISLCNI